MIQLELDISVEDLRRSVAFPSGQLLAFGGDDGTLISIDTSAKSKTEPSMHIARQYDDPVCALAVSWDGKRVAVAVDNGAIKIYQYDEYDANGDDPHPFVRPPKTKSADDEDDGGFLSQSAEYDDVDEEDDEGRCWAGPPMEGLVRNMNFLPDSHYLAISSESGLTVINVETSDTMADRYLTAQVDKEHDGSGIRGVDINDKKWMASLAMDGRLCVWDVSGIQSASSGGDHVPVYRDESRCVPHKDVGVMMEANFFDRSCLPVWVQTGVLALPGKSQLQLRAVSVTDESFSVKESAKKSVAEPSRGHIESIGALASVGENMVVSAGQDGRVNLWQIEEDDHGLPIAEFVEKLGDYESIPTSFHWDDKNYALYVFCANATLDIIKDLQKRVKQKKKGIASARNLSTKQTDEVAAEKTMKKNVPQTSSSTSTPSKTSAGLDKRSQQIRKRISYADSEPEEDDPGNRAFSAQSKGRNKSVLLNEPHVSLEKHDDIEESSQFVHLETQPPDTNKDTETGKKPFSDEIASRKSDDEGDKLKSLQSDTKMNAPGSSLQSLIDEMGSDDDDDFDKPSQSKESENLAFSKETTDDDVDQLEKATKKVAKSKVNMASRRLSKQAEATQDDNDEDDDIFDNLSVQNTNPTNKNSFIDDEAEDGEGDVPESPAADVEAAASRDAAGSPITSTQHKNDQGDENVGGDSDSDGGYGNNDDDEHSMQDDIDAINDTFGKSREYLAGSARGGPPVPEPQAAFAPSSTPLDLQRRFLCWNNVGSITLLKGGDAVTRSTVDINFTDSAFRRPVSFTDNMGFIMGSLGDDGAMFATDLAHDEEDDLDDEDWAGLSLSEQTKAALKKSQKQRMRKGSSSNKRPMGSSIYFHRFETFAALREKDWYLTLPDGELILGCACGKGWAAVMTSRKFLRLFTSGGAQGQVIWLPGTPVTMVGRDRFLAVCYHESTPLLDGTQKLGYMLYDAVANKTITKGSVSCISAGSSLSWVGFSNDCSLLAMDSDGMLSMLVATSVDGLAEEDSQGLVEPVSWEWSPFLDTVGMRKSSDDGFWPISVYNGKLVCIPLKGGIQYPDAGRRPITTTISLRIPLAHSTLTKSSALEELCVRSNVALAQKKANNLVACGELMGEDFVDEYHTLCAQVDKVTLKLFAATVEAGKLERALDLVDRLHLAKSYDISMTIAESHDRLVDYIEEAKERKFAQLDDEVEEASDVEDNFGSDDGNTQFDGPASTSPEHRSQATRRISPDAANTGKLKRPLDQHQFKRDVRAKAF